MSGMLHHPRDADCPTTSGAYSAKNETKDRAQVEYSREELVEEWWFKPIERDGRRI